MILTTDDLRALGTRSALSVSEYKPTRCSHPPTLTKPLGLHLRSQRWVCVQWSSVIFPSRAGSRNSRAPAFSS